MKRGAWVQVSVWVAVVALVVAGCAAPAASSESLRMETPLAPAAEAGSGLEEGAPDRPVATLTPEAGGAGADPAQGLSEDYENALSVRNQLALGTLRLAESEQAVTPEQAGELLFYWQALKALGTSSTTSSAETEAVQGQIHEALTPDQLAAIAALRLTNDDLNAFYVAQGFELTTPEPGVTPMAGRNSGLSREEREAAKATAQAQGTPVGMGQGSGGGAARRDALMDVLIAYLETKAQE